MPNKGNYSSKRKRQPVEWGKAFKMIYLIRGCYPKNIKELTQSKNKERNDWIKKWAEDMKRRFSKEDIQMANRDVKRCSTLLIIQEIQIKITTRHHLTPVRMATIKKGTNTCWQRCGKKGTLRNCCWGCRLVLPLHKRMEVLQKSENRTPI